MPSGRNPGLDLDQGLLLNNISSPIPNEQNVLNEPVAAEISNCMVFSEASYCNKNFCTSIPRASEQYDTADASVTAGNSDLVRKQAVRPRQRRGAHRRPLRTKLPLKKGLKAEPAAREDINEVGTSSFRRRVEFGFRRGSTFEVVRRANPS